MYKWKPPTNPPPSFESGEEMLEWYRKTYRIPRIKRKIKSIGKNFVKDLRIKLGGTYKGTNIPSHIMKKGVGSPELRNHLLNQLEASFDEVEKAAKKRISKEQRATEKRFSQAFKNAPWKKRTPNLLLRGALGKAAGILSVLIPSGTIIPDEAVDHPDPWFRDEMKRQSLAQQTIRSYGPNLKATQKRLKGMKKDGRVKKTSWNY